VAGYETDLGCHERSSESRGEELMQPLRIADRG
jgi:hypothetical protein